MPPIDDRRNEPEARPQPSDGNHDHSGTAESLLPGPVLALGERIVTEFGTTTDSLTARWMAYRIAQLMNAADTASSHEERETAAAQCTDLILRLWKNRSHWPAGWPPDVAADVAEALRDRRHPFERIPIPEEGDSFTWLTTLRFAEESLKEETALWTLAALADEDTAGIQSWLGQEGAQFEEIEHETLRTVTETAAQAPELLAQRLRADRTATQDTTNPTGRAAAITARLRALATTRLTMAEQVASAITARADADARGNERNGEA